MAVNLINSNDITITQTGDNIQLEAPNIGDLTNLNTTDKSSLVEAINELKDGEEYSTSEVKTNKKWINGKPIYRKTYVFSNLTGSGRTIDITNLNMDTFLPYEAVGTWSNGGAINWPYYISNTDNGRLYRASSTQVNINYTLPDYNSRGLIVTLYYTKTTD